MCASAQVKYFNCIYGQPTYLPIVCCVRNTKQNRMPQTKSNELSTIYRALVCQSIALRARKYTPILWSFFVGTTLAKLRNSQSAIWSMTCNPISYSTGDFTINPMGIRIFAATSLHRVAEFCAINYIPKAEPMVARTNDLPQNVVHMWWILKPTKRALWTSIDFNYR